MSAVALLATGRAIEFGMHQWFRQHHNREQRDDFGYSVARTRA
jgi:hypothetical protein